MSVNVQLTCSNAPEYTTKDLTHLNYQETDILASECIVKDILADILKTVAEKSDQDTFKKCLEIQQNVYEDIKKKNPDLTLLDSDLIGLNEKYTEDYQQIVNSLNTRKTKQGATKPSISGEISKVMEEVKTLVDSVRSLPQDGKGDIVSKSPTLDTTTVTNMHCSSDHGKKYDLSLLDDLTDEIVLQVIDLAEEEDSDISSQITAENLLLPPEEDLDEVNLSRQSDGSCAMDKGDQQPINIVILDAPIASYQADAGETAVENPVPDPEPNKLEQSEKPEEKKKKKSLGTRIWHFLTKSSRPASVQSLAKKQSNNDN